MAKSLLIYAITFILLFSIVSPSYHALKEGKIKVELSSELGEEEENKENKAEEDSETKINEVNNKTLFKKSLALKKNVVFIAKDYVFYRSSLESPPPELIG